MNAICLIQTRCYVCNTAVPDDCLCKNQGHSLALFTCLSAVLILPEQLALCPSKLSEAGGDPLCHELFSSGCSRTHPRLPATQWPNVPLQGLLPAALLQPGPPPSFPLSSHTHALEQCTPCFRYLRLCLCLFCWLLSYRCKSKIVQESLILVQTIIGCFLLVLLFP